MIIYILLSFASSLRQKNVRRSKNVKELTIGQRDYTIRISTRPNSVITTQIRHKPVTTVNSALLLTLQKISKSDSFIIYSVPTKIMISLSLTLRQNGARSTMIIIKLNVCMHTISKILGESLIYSDMILNFVKIGKAVPS